MRRVCFTLQVRPDRLEEYRRRHEAVWPELPEIFNLDAQLGQSR